MPRIDKLATENLTVAIFKTHSTRNETKSKAAGRPIYDDIEVCELRFAANRQTVGVYPAHEVFKWHDDPESGERTPLTYALAYPDQYRKFKAGEAQVASGTPLGELPFLSQGKRLELKALNIHTAESLAALDGQALRMLGQGGRELKEKAQAYLDAATSTAVVTDQAELIAQLRARIEQLEVGRPAESPADSDADDKQVNSDSPFASMDPEDIVNWLTEVTKKKPRKNLSKAELVKLADETNAELAQKATEAAA
jgi:hypothetical protein